MAKSRGQRSHHFTLAVPRYEEGYCCSGALLDYAQKKDERGHDHGPHADALKTLNKQQKIVIREGDGWTFESGALTCSTLGREVIRFPAPHSTVVLAQPMPAGVPCPVEISVGGGLIETGDNTEASWAGEGRGLKIVVEGERRGGENELGQTSVYPTRRCN